MKSTRNYQGGKVDAYKQFTNDLKNDKDFIQFRQRALDVNTGHSYGVVIVRTNRFTIEKVNQSNN